MKTYVPSGKDVSRKWHIIDAEGATLGRLATKAARILMGKHKPTYTPYLDQGDHVIVINEPGRALDAGDIEAVTSTPVTAVIDADPAIARAVDAGTLATAMPRSLTRALTPIVAGIVGARS